MRDLEQMLVDAPRKVWIYTKYGRQHFQMEPTRPFDLDDGWTALGPYISRDGHKELIDRASQEHLDAYGHSRSKRVMYCPICDLLKALEK